MPKVLPPEVKADKPQPEEKIKQEALSVIDRAAAVRITNQETYNLATDILTKEIKPMRKRWKEYWEEIKSPLRASLNAVQAKFNEADEKLEAAEKSIKAEIVRFDDEQRRIQEEAQRKAQEEAERLEQARRTEQAVELEQQGVSDEEIEALMDAPVMAVAAPVTPTYQKASDVSRRENWKARVTDIKALCKAIGAGKVPPNYVLPNEPVLNARAKADKTTMNVPGVVAFDDPIIAGRGR